MNYEVSPVIRNKIQSATSILLNCHRNPDPDTVSSALGMRLVLQGMGKKVTVICPDTIGTNLDFLPGIESIQTVDFKTYDFSKFDLFIAQDSSSYDQITGDKSIQLPEISLVVIDHHKTNDGFGEINCVDSDRSANAEVLYRLLSDWNFAITPEIAQCLLTGIIADTGAFVYPDANADTLTTAGDLIRAGADKNKIIFNLFRRHSLARTQLIGEILTHAQLDQQYHFVWSIIPHDIFSKYNDKEAKAVAASVFMQNIEGSDFGIIITQGEENTVWVNFRARMADFDVSKIGVELGGGGHKVAAGATLTGISFDQAVEKVLTVARKYAKK
jgi:phosphoesterase RecJ-like protein